MRKHKEDRSYLWDMLEASRSACSFVKDKSIHQFLSDKLLRSAVERQLEIIGEAAIHLSVELKQNHPHIPWKVIIGQRHVLAHDYDEIKYERLWSVCQKDIPALIEQLEPLFPQQPEESKE
ncbi:MAG: DUF86 domain-containing protein [Candidatus Omnitrophota bacterium]|jgi:uncharacterized protein with HEPN domain|nr:MAG: DUF86 domain-containing protein [Candidatus Omnitrophota bacterium]